MLNNQVWETVIAVHADQFSWFLIRLTCDIYLLFNIINSFLFQIYFIDPYRIRLAKFNISISEKIAQNRLMYY